MVAFIPSKYKFGVSAAFDWIYSGMETHYVTDSNLTNPFTESKCLSNEKISLILSFSERAIKEQSVTDKFLYLLKISFIELAKNS